MSNKRVVRMVVIVALIGAFLLAVAPALAFGPGGQGLSKDSIAKEFVDADGDGVCDNDGMGFVDADGDGVCDNDGMGFVDADGDGVCDNFGTGTGFVDADGDGVCDNDGMGFVDADGDGVCDNDGVFNNWDGTQSAGRGSAR